ncbi:MAG: hypothetical protein ACK2UW_23355 [Anaerolineales bacterium]
MLILRKFIIFVLLCLGLLGCQPQSTSPGFSPKLPDPTAISTLAKQETPAATSDAFANTSQNGKGNADVKYVRVVQEVESTWTFHVTVSHPDQGWEDYADGWDIVLPDGHVLKPDPAAQFSRTLLHPHVDEQPFTRSISGVKIPAGITQVLVRAHDLVDGYGGEIVVVDFQELSGINYLIESSR